MWDIKDVESYFYAETKDMEISEITLIETKHVLSFIKKDNFAFFE